jgi:hypothetical protein
VTYARLASTLLKHKRKFQPKIPKTARDYDEGLKNTSHTYGKNYLGSYKVDGEVGGILFGSQKLIEYFIRAKQIFFDATFKIAPKLFYQVLTIKFPFEGKTFPALVIVMKGKSREHYDAAFSKVKELFPEFNPTHGMADHEVAARASAQQIFDGLLVKSCWFHYWYVQKFFCLFVFDCPSV